MCLRTGFSLINAIVLTGKTWYPALGAGTCGGTRVMQVLRGKPLPARQVGVPRTWKGFGHEKNSVSASDRCHHRYHSLGDTITSSRVAGRLGSRSRRRSNCWYGDRWNSGRRPRPWPRLLLLPRTARRLRLGCILRPLVLYGVSIRSVIARCDAEVRTTKVAERSAAFFVPTRAWLDATKVMRRSRRARLLHCYCPLIRPGTIITARFGQPDLLRSGRGRVCPVRGRYVHDQQPQRSDGESWGQTISSTGAHRLPPDTDR